MIECWMKNGKRKIIRGLFSNKFPPKSVSVIIKNNVLNTDHKTRAKQSFQNRMNLGMN